MRNTTVDEKWIRMNIGESLDGLQSDLIATVSVVDVRQTPCLTPYSVFLYSKLDRLYLTTHAVIHVASASNRP